MGVIGAPAVAGAAPARTPRGVAATGIGTIGGAGAPGVPGMAFVAVVAAPTPRPVTRDRYAVRPELRGADRTSLAVVVAPLAPHKLTDLLLDALPEDLLKFGLIPGFVGRLPVIGAVSNLDRDALVRILVEPKNALVKQYRRVFELDNVELEIREDALEAIAEQALLRGTGCRALRAIIEEVLLEVMYDLPSRSDVGRCVIDRSVVLEHVAPTLLARVDEKPERTRRVAS